MKAAVLSTTDPEITIADKLKIQNIPDPEIKDGDVLIKINFASINHRDVWISNGKYAKIILPAVLGSDGSGTVVKDTSGKFKAGDRVVINPGFNWNSEKDHQQNDFKILGMPDNGTFAEFVSIPFENVFLLPDKIDLQEAASLPVAGVTAFKAVKKAKVSRGSNVLITGIGGGVAMFCLQFCIKLGCNVYVTSSSDEKIEKSIRLGAVGGLNYLKGDWEKGIKQMNIDVFFDGAGGTTFEKIISFAKFNSKIISYGATLGNSKLESAKLFWKQLNIIGTTMGSPYDFEEMIHFVKENSIKPVVDSIFDLNDISTAFQKISEHRQFGKILLKIS